MASFQIDLKSEAMFNSDVIQVPGVLQGRQSFLVKGLGNHYAAHEVTEHQNTEQPLDTNGFLEVYQDWCGPCKPLKEMSKRLFFDYADKGLKFYTCEAGTLQRTQEYKGSCKPCFLFYKDGSELPDLKIEGVDYPRMVSNVTKILNA